MKLLMKYNGTYLIPASEDSVEAYDKLQQNVEYKVEVMQARNPKFHRLGFALVKGMFDNQERFTNFEDFRRELKIMTGCYDEYTRHNGETVYIPQSWSWADMDETRFHEIHNKLLSIASKRYGDHFAEQFA